MLGSWKIEFECPACKAPLNTKESAIGQNDDCQLCGAEFLISPTVRDQIAAIEDATADQEREAERQKKDADAERRKEQRKAELARREEVAEEERNQKERDDERGYDYPNLRKYQASLETTAVVGAFLLCLLAGGFLVFGIAGMAGTGSASPTAVLGMIASIAICLFGAASWYYGWIVTAEMLRLTVTVALDIRSIRDAHRQPEQ
jgi:hypothetical protein